MVESIFSYIADGHQHDHRTKSGGLLLATEGMHALYSLPEYSDINAEYIVIVEREFEKYSDHINFGGHDVESCLAVLQQIFSWSDEVAVAYAFKMAVKAMGSAGVQCDRVQRMVGASSHLDLAKKLIENGQRWAVVWRQNRLDGIEDIIAPLTEQDYQEVFAEAKERAPDLEDEAIAGQFERAAVVFGYKRMFQYKDKEWLSFHDAVHAMDEILGLYEASGLSPNEFYNNILAQVMADGATYDAGTAYHQINAIAQSVDTDIAGILEKAKRYQGIDRLRDLVLVFSTPETVFASWVNLKRYSELQQLLDQAEMLEELKALKESGKDDLYNYVKTLAFHEDSKINMRKVFQFWREPEAFLAAPATDTRDEVQNRKKPSNYMNTPNLDLTAEDLRDALVEGKMDTLQVFSPMEIRYQIPLRGIEKPLSMRDAFFKAVGKRSENKPGEAAQQGKPLFGKANALLKQYQPKQKKGEKPKKLNLVSYLNGEELPEELIKPMEDLLYDKDIGIPRQEIKTQEYIAKIFNKSDPEGAIAGNDTANCMPYGDGKNTVYTYNPNTAQFVIRVVKSDGTERTIAQSVITKDMDVKTAVPEIRKKMYGQARLEQILPEDILTQADTYLACDNIEVAPNYTKDEQAIETIYRDFFNEYMQRCGHEQGLNTEKVPIGTGYADALKYLPTEENTYIPQAPVSYSDKKGEEVYTLTLEEQDVQKRYHRVSNRKTRADTAS